MIKLSVRAVFFCLTLGGLLLGCTDTKTPIERPSEETEVEEVVEGGNDLRVSGLALSEIVSKSGDDTYLGGNDWVELVNLGDEVLYLDDYFLADSASGLIRLPAVALSGGEYFVVAAVDSEDAMPEFPSVPFKLGSEDSLYLYLNDELVDTLLWSDGDADQGDGFGVVGSQRLTTIPTPGIVNRSAPSLVIEPVETTAENPLSVSEIVAKSDDDFLQSGDWIELYNSGDDDVNLSAYSLSDSRSDRVRLPSHWLSAGQYVIVAAVDSEAADPPLLSVPFKLGSEDSVLLYFGDDLVSGLVWQSGDAPLGSSYGVLGGDQKTLKPTPGFVNVGL